MAHKSQCISVSHSSEWVGSVRHSDILALTNLTVKTQIGIGPIVIQIAQWVGTLSTLQLTLLHAILLGHQDCCLLQCFLYFVMKSIDMISGHVFLMLWSHCDGIAKKITTYFDYSSGKLCVPFYFPPLWNVVLRPL